MYNKKYNFWKFFLLSLGIGVITDYLLHRSVNFSMSIPILAVFVGIFIWGLFNPP